MSTDQAYEFLVEHLAEVSKLSGQEAERWRQNHQQGDLHIPDAAWLFWKRTLGNALQSFSDLTEEHYVSFYDAAWELSRQGILRFGQYIPRGQSARTGGGDVYSITKYGRHWLLNAADRATVSPFKMASLFQSFSPQFGDGFNQRATEAVGAYRAGNYLSACVMAGAAAESILLALAITKSGNEEKVLKEYSTSHDRLWRR
jgi:hypothetical protein